MVIVLLGALLARDLHGPCRSNAEHLPLAAARVGSSSGQVIIGPKIHHRCGAVRNGKMHPSSL